MTCVQLQSMSPQKPLATPYKCKYEAQIDELEGANSPLIAIDFHTLQFIYRLTNPPSSCVELLRRQKLSREAESVEAKVPLYFAQKHVNVRFSTSYHESRCRCYPQADVCVSPDYS